VRLLESSSGELREATACALSKMYVGAVQQPDFFTILMRLIGEGEIDLCGILMEENGMAFADSSLLAFLAEELQQGDPERQYTALNVVDSIGPAAARNPDILLAIAGLLQTDQRELLDAAIHAIGEIGQDAFRLPAVVPALAHSLRRDDLHFAVHAASTLTGSASRHPDILRAVTDLLQSDHPSQQIRAVNVPNVLAFLVAEQPSIGNVLFDLIQSSEGELRAAFTRAVMKLDSEVVMAATVSRVHELVNGQMNWEYSVFANLFGKSGYRLFGDLAKPPWRIGTVKELARL
jgi:hypothetical protein